jgi:hypothetical protein
MAHIFVLYVKRDTDSKVQKWRTLVAPSCSARQLSRKTWNR